MNAVTVSALQAFPRQLEAHYAAIPAGFKNWAPASWEGVPSEPLTAIEQVCHVRDIEIDGYHVRLHRTLNEFHPTLVSVYLCSHDQQHLAGLQWLLGKIEASRTRAAG